MIKVTILVEDNGRSDLISQVFDLIDGQALALVDEMGHELRDSMERVAQRQKAKAMRGGA